jgi:hypothetical protein
MYPKLNSAAVLNPVGRVGDPLIGARSFPTGKTELTSRRVQLFYWAGTASRGDP